MGETLSIHQLEIEELAEIKSFPDQEGDNNLRQYMIENWYFRDSFVLWGRMHETAIPLTNTTMYVEAHWSMIKKGVLKNYNRPGVDIVLFLIERKIMLKIKCEMTLLLRGREMPNFWYQFKFFLGES